MISDMEFLTSGFESEIYTFNLKRLSTFENKYILRLFMGDGAAGKLAREARALSLLQTAGYPVPALLLQEADPDFLGRPFEIIERLEGQALWPVIASAEPSRQKELLSRFGSLLAQLHQLDWRAFIEKPESYEETPSRLLDDTISHYRALYTKYHLTGFLQLTDWLDSHKHEISVRPAVVHQDFHANNVLLCTDDHMAVIDWTQFAISDSRIDLCWTLLVMGELGDPDWSKQILQAYTSHSNRPVKHLDYFHVIVSMKLLASTVIAYNFSPEEVGLRAEAVALTKEQATRYQELSRQIRTITGLAVPELQDMLESV